MRKIVIHCASGLKNSGDEAILQALLKAIPHENEIYVISFDAEYTRKMHTGVNAINQKDYISCRKIIKECDLFVLGGGGLLQDETTIFNVRRWLSKLSLALKFGKKTYIYANSIGPIKYWFNKNQTASLLKKVDMITLRDHESQKLLSGLGVSKNVYVTADPVFSFEAPEEDFCNKVLSKFQLEEGYVFVSIRHWFDVHPFIPVRIANRFNIRTSGNRKKHKIFIDEMTKIVDHLGDSLNKKVVFAPFCIGRDENPAEEIMSHVQDTSFCLNIKDDFITPLEYMALIKKSDFVVGMRLHSLIFSIVCEKPFIALSYSQKVQNLLCDNNLTAYGIPVEKLEFNFFQKLILKFLENRTALENQIRDIRVANKRFEKGNSAFLTALLASDEEMD